MRTTQAAAQLLIGLLLLSGCTHAPSFAVQAIHEERFVRVGGIEQWVTIHGDDRRNPVVLFLHGGPGNTLTPFAEVLYGSWTNEFTIVQWDQRGAGRTYGRNPPAATLTIGQMTADGVELAAFLAEFLSTDSVILVGGSWGSILGVHMVHARPELFRAYVGVSQVVGMRENQAATYARLLTLARDDTDTASLAILERIGPPPWSNPRHPGAMRRLTRAYEAKVTTPAPSAWWLRAPAYATPEALSDYTEGEDFSYLQFVGLQGDGMYADVDLPKLGSAFDVPVYIVQGAEDLVTTRDVTERYFAGIAAPEKKLIVVPDAGHDPNVAMIRATFDILKTLRERTGR